MNFIPKIIYSSPEITVQFQYPPEFDFRGENYASSSITTTANNGSTQTQWNFNELVKDMNFKFVSESIKQAYEEFFLNWGSKGKEFKYYESSDEVDFITVQLERKSFKPEIIMPSDIPNEYIYEFQVALRQLL